MNERKIRSLTNFHIHVLRQRTWKRFCLVWNVFIHTTYGIGELKTEEERRSEKDGRSPFVEEQK